jgi:hypothetical protein
MSFRVTLSCRSFLLLPLAVLGLSACTVPPKADKDPQALDNKAMLPVVPVPAPAVEQVAATAMPESGISPLEERVLALEKNMIGVQSEVATSRPILRKVDAMERNFKALSLELDRIDRDYAISSVAGSKEKSEEKAEASSKAETPSSPLLPKPSMQQDQPDHSAAVKRTYVPKPVFRPLPKKVEAVAPAQPNSHKLTVRNLRVGEKNGGVTRIVLDTNSPARLNYDLDNNEKILVIEVPDSGWAAQKSASLTSSPLVASYKAESDKTGSRLILQLKKEATVLSTARLAAGKGSGDRVYLDIAPKK